VEALEARMNDRFVSMNDRFAEVGRRFDRADRDAERRHAEFDHLSLS